MVTGPISRPGAFTQSRTWPRALLGKESKNSMTFQLFFLCHMVGRTRRTLQSHSSITFPRFLESYSGIFRFSAVWFFPGYSWTIEKSLNEVFCNVAQRFTKRLVRGCANFSSCSCLTALPGPSWVLLSTTYKPSCSLLYITHSEMSAGPDCRPIQ